MKSFLMSASNILNIIGLTFDLIGVIMLFKYGLPPEVSRTGSIFLVTEKKNSEEIAKAKKLERCSYVALILIIIGFLFQISANLFPLFSKNEHIDEKITVNKACSLYSYIACNDHRRQHINYKFTSHPHQVLSSHF